MPYKIVVVTKDIAEFQIYQPVVALLRERGHTVVVVAEGLSLDKWIDVGELVYKGSGVQEGVDSQTLCRSDIDADEVLKELKPDLVLTGLGAPINLGQTFGLAANALGITLGYVIDVWGAESRSSAVPNFICTLDGFGKAMIACNKSYCGRTIHVHTTGSPAMDRLAKVQEPDLPIFNSVIGEWTIVLFVGQDESTIPALGGLVKALNETGEPYLLIPRFHPKFANRLELRMLRNEILASANGYVLQAPAKISTQELMKVAGYTVSIYSNALIEAAALGSLPVSWISDIGREKMAQALGGLTRFPLVDMKCAVEVETQTDFQQLLLALDPYDYEAKIRHCQSVYKCDGENTERVVQAIIAELR